MTGEQLYKEHLLIQEDMSDILSKHCDVQVSEFKDMLLVNVYDLKELIMLAKERVR